MRKPRLKILDGPAVYHCISRIVGGQFLLDDPEREQLRHMLWQQAEFCGIQLVTYAILSNHFHVLARVPLHGEVPDAELVARAEVLYPPKAPLLVLLRAALDERDSIPDDLKRRLLRRMGDISVFLKELKQRFSRWYNGQHDRFGTLWAERFTSLLVEDEPCALRAVAAYIDLNAVRAGLVTDPKEYRFCGYGEAAAGAQRAQEGLLSCTTQQNWASAGPEYRKWLFVDAARAGKSGKVVLGKEQILKVLAERGEISWAEALQLRIRYLSAGLALGSELYVNGIFLKFRDRFGQKRRTGARKLRGLPFTRLRTLRDLRIMPVS